MPIPRGGTIADVFIDRAGKNLPAKRKKALEQAKVELRTAFGVEDVR